MDMRQDMEARFFFLSTLRYAVLGLVIAGCAGSKTFQVSEQTQRGPLAAEVYGQPILVEEVDARIREELFEERVHGDQRLLFELRSKVLERMIDAKIRVAEAARRAQRGAPPAVASDPGLHQHPRLVVASEASAIAGVRRRTAAVAYTAGASSSAAAAQSTAQQTESAKSAEAASEAAAASAAAASQAAAQPAAPKKTTEQKLQELQSLYKQGLITESDYNASKAKILDEVSQ